MYGSADYLYIGGDRSDFTIYNLYIYRCIIITDGNQNILNGRI
ncbi:MAG: hypothetical protein V7K21_06355 [Nostoc sp.]